jgi:two-component system sensor histidine kinase BarA
MVAHFDQKHNRALSKHSLFTCFYFIACCFFIQHSGTAFAANKDAIELTNPQQSQLVSNYFAVYRQESSVLSLTEFLQSKTFIPYRKFEDPNYGFVKDGVWLYSKLVNKTELDDWVLSIRFAQLQEADVYVLQNDQIIYQGSDGILNKQGPFALPSFDIPFPPNQEVDIYIYLRSNSMSLMAPIYIESHASFEKTSMLDFTIWGVLYGALAVLIIYTIVFLSYRPSLISSVFLLHLVTVFAFEILWSGQNAITFVSLSQVYEHLRAESFILLMAISSSIFSLTIVPASLHGKHLSKMMYIVVVISAFFFLLFFTSLLPIEWRLLLTYGLGFANISLNILMSLRAYLSGFFPARPMLVGWALLLIGAFINSAFIFGIVPPYEYLTHLFQLALVAQCLVFLLAIVLKNQYDLQLEVKEAQTDAENNFGLIEEQNVHLDIARKAALKASEVKSQFLANMSHEIRTPLNAIIGFSKELESKQYVVERDEHVRIINSAATDLLTIVNDILDFSKMEAGKLVLNVKPFSPRDILEDVVALMAKSAHLKQLEFVFDVGDLPPSVIGDGFKIKQLLSNLLSNGLKFTNYGYITLSAKVLESGTKHCEIEFQVRDTGIGINSEDVGKLFTAFHQLDDELNRSFQGTGLGLVICQELTRLMKGSIEVDSEPNVGSTFTAVIPFILDREVHSIRKNKPFANHHAILVDEWPLSQKATSQQLAIAGFNVDIVDNISAIKSLNLSNDYVFVSLPFRSNENRNRQLEELANLRPSKLVLLYSGPSPSSASFGGFSNQPYLIRLPLTTQKLRDIETTSNQVFPTEASKKLSKLPPIRMLAVDDIDLNLRLLETWMAPSPVTLDLAYDGKTAIKYCEKQEYDIILMDIQMPNMDGLETTSYIRKTELNIGTPIIAITAHALASEKQHFLDSGMDDFLPKPIQIDSLIAVIKSWCNQVPEQNVAAPESIDWELALERSYGNKDAAISFLDTFVERLGEHSEEIESGWKQQRVDIVLASVHKLHGACCYTGVPRLQEYCHEAETTLKTDTLESNSKALSTLLLEIEQVEAKWPKRRETLGI